MQLRRRGTWATISLQAKSPSPWQRPPRRAAVSANPSAGHLSVHVEGAHPVDIPFQFEQQQKRMGPAFVASFAYHVAMVGIDAAGAALRRARHGARRRTCPTSRTAQIVWLSQPGPGGGGGGGGNQMKEPPRKAELPGKDKITVPAEKPPKLEQPKQAKNEPNPLEQLNIPAKTLAAATESLPGRDRSAARAADALAGLGHRRRVRNRDRARASGRARARVSGRAAAAAPAAASISRATASRCRASCAR